MEMLFSANFFVWLNMLNVPRISFLNQTAHSFRKDYSASGFKDKLPTPAPFHPSLL